MRNISKERSQISEERIVSKMKCKFLILFVVAALAALLSPPFASATSILGSAESFAVLGGSTVTNTGATIITGDLGVHPGSAITGFPPGSVTGGTITTDAVAQQAQIDTTAAYVSLAAMPFTTDLTGQDLGGKILTSGVYLFTGSAGLTGALTLDADYKNNAFWVFQIGSTLITAPDSIGHSSVQVIHPGFSPNYGLFWQVGSSATLDVGTAFEGNILALASITLNTDATIGCGRALAQTAAVNMNTNTISNGCGGSGYSGGLMFEGEGKDKKIVAIGPSPVPIPSAAWLLGSGLLGLIGLQRRRARKA